MRRTNESQKRLSIQSLWHNQYVMLGLISSVRGRLAVLVLGIAASLATPALLISQNVSSPSQFFEYQRLKLDSDFSRFERERAEFARRKEAESLNLDSYASQLAEAVSCYRAHIADQHQRYVSCKQCRKLVKTISEFSRKIERGSH